MDEKAEGNAEVDVLCRAPAMSREGESERSKRGVLVRVIARCQMLEGRVEGGVGWKRKKMERRDQTAVGRSGC